MQPDNNLQLNQHYAAARKNDSPANTTAQSKQRVKQRFLRQSADDALPLCLTHERIYILPTARGWVFVMTLLIMLVTSINYALSLGYALSFLLTGLFSATLMATYKNMAGIVLHSNSGSNAVVGGQADFHLQLENPGATDCRDLLIKSENSRCTLVDIHRHGFSKAILSVDATRRGWQKLGRITFSSDYPLGLWNAWGYMHTPVEALIWPAPENNAPEIPAPDNSSAHKTETTALMSASKSTQGDFSSLREYREGDAITAIAWKHTARGQGLFTREHEESTRADVTLSWQDSHIAGDTEARLSRMAAWCDRCTQDGVGYTLVLPNITAIEPDAVDTPLQHRARCMEALALFARPDSGH